MGGLTYGVLKTVSSLLADWNVDNTEFFMLFHSNPQNESIHSFKLKLK